MEVLLQVYFALSQVVSAGVLPQTSNEIRFNEEPDHMQSQVVIERKLRTEKACDSFMY